MKPYALVLGLLALTTVLSGCSDIFSPDNYEAPNSTLTGQVTYQGTAVPVATDRVELDLWQPGEEFELEQDIDVFVDQEGSFAAVLFDGSYEVNLIDGQGPWVDNATRIPFDVNGDTTIEVPVTPYYLVENPSIVNNNDVVEATFNIGQIDTSRDVEFVGLYVSTTRFVDRANEIGTDELDASAIPDLDATISLSFELPEDIREAPGSVPRANVWARVGIKTVGKAHLVYSPVEQLEL